MKRQIKILSTAFFLLWGTAGIYAQEDQHQHELSVYGGGGLSTLAYKVTAGNQHHGLGGHFGLGYHFFFAPKWALGTGAEFAFYNARFKMNNFDIRYMTTDMQGGRFEFRSTVNDYVEKQHATMIQIPLMLYHQSIKNGSKPQYFGAVGAKYGIAMNGKYRNKATLNNAGYYEYEDALYDTQEFMGFGNFPGRKDKGGLDFINTFFLSAEAGVKWRLNESWSLYTGVYLDYGLNNIIETQNIASLPNLVAYNRINPTSFGVNSIVESHHTQNNGASQAFTEKITPIAAGIKLRLAFGKDCGQKKSQPTPQKEPAPVPVAKPVEEKTPEPVVEEEAPEIVEETPEVVEEKPSPVDEGMPEAVKRQIEQPIDNYVVSHTEVAAYQRERLDEKIALLQKYPNMRFYIYGHTCELGTKEVNERVGLGRAAHAKTYMISKGIAESRILSISSKRDTEPVVPNSSEENRKKNRRVTIILE